MLESFSEIEREMLANIASNYIKSSDDILDTTTFRTLYKKQAINFSEGAWRVIPLIFQYFMAGPYKAKKANREIPEAPNTDEPPHWSSMPGGSAP
ncbi:MAG TPA: hypothetical protein VHP83_27845 [Aggregatilineaceae bacterium]|nr:hypothetical protein [Aggregatilineaceae bacterium]